MQYSIQLNITKQNKLCSLENVLENGEIVLECPGNVF